MKQELIISYTENMDVLQEERKFMQIFQRERISIVAGWIGMRFIAPMTFKGGCDKEVFNIWLEKMLYQFPLYKQRIENNGKKPY
ncbi:hypothetical protein [Wolbachia endosymbiont of Tetranychus urticae]|uniref:hypothetical protein n=1 Tax=Wolbachia endosymbiont of Tetranychus urticae TaxID=169184 RepID=UPI00397A7730